MNAFVSSFLYSSNLQKCIIIIAILGIAYCFYGIDYAWSESRHFWITFNNLTVIDNHEVRILPYPSCPSGDCAKWVFLAYVNGKAINLIENLNLSSIEGNTVYSLDNKSIDVEVAENGTLRMVSTGIELDAANIPDISNLTKAVSGIPYARDVAAAADAVRYIVATIAEQNDHDPLGIVAKDFEYLNGFGIGNHQDASCFKDDIEALCDEDYVLGYSVTEFEPIPQDSLIAELFIHEKYTGPNAIIRNNTASLGSVFDDSISSIRVYSGPNYRQGDYVEICEEPYFSGKCLTLEPGEYNLDPLFNFGDAVDSIRFIHLNR